MFSQNKKFDKFRRSYTKFSKNSELKNYCGNYAKTLATYHCEVNDSTCARIVYLLALPSCLHRYYKTGILYDSFHIRKDLDPNYLIRHDIGNKSTSVEVGLEPAKSAIRKTDKYCEKFAWNVHNYQCATRSYDCDGVDSDYGGTIFHNALRYCQRNI